MATAQPDLSDRPHGLTVERRMTASPAALYAAWTEGWERWFAAPGTVLMRAEVDAPFFLLVEHEGKRFPHYGRFLRLERDRLVELAWLTGKGGTDGAETVVTVTLEGDDGGTRLTLSHKGFYTEAAARQHAEAWPMVLAQMDARISGSPGS